MIDRYIEYLSGVRRYSPRTCEIYRSVLEEYLCFCSDSVEPSKASARQNFALRAHPSQPDGWAPPVHETTGGHGSAGQSLAEAPSGAEPTDVSGGSYPWSEVLSVQDVRRYEVYLMDERKESARTVNLHLSVLSGFCKFLIKQGALESNPVRLVSRPKQEKRLPAFYREDAMQAYFEQTKGVLEYGRYEDQLRRMILGLLYGTGLRRSELIGLNRNSVDWSRHTLRVLGKGDKIREIPLLPSLCDEILLYLQSVDSLKYADKTPEAPLLQTPKGGRLYPVYVDRAVKEALGGVSGISGRKSPHVLRHTLATELLDGGADLNSIKEMLGHSSLAATQVYTHNSIERLQNVYNSAHPRAKNDGNHGD
jgi:integrase/recombinase XerC